MIAIQRFQIRRDRFWRPFLWPFGGSAEWSYLEVDSKGLHLQFGLLVNLWFPFNEIIDVRRSNWPWWGGIGWRSNLIGRIGLVGSYDGIVDVDLRHRHWVRLVFFPLPCRRITVSLEDPDGFVAALNARLAAVA